MKLPFTIYDLRFTIWKKSGGAVSPLTAAGAHGVTRPAALNHQSSIENHKFQRAFTMVEIAISLAIIGIALVGILAALPRGLQIQPDNREKTVVNQDAAVLLEAIRGGARGLDDLTNYVFMITNTYAHAAYSNFTSGARIVGLLSTPEFVDANFQSTIPANAVSSNRMVAFTYSLSGPAVEKPPQLNGSLIRQSSFSYGLVCENMPVPMDPNAVTNSDSTYGTELAANLHELRLTFLWSLLPDSQPPRVHYGTGNQTYRALVAGRQVLDTTTWPGVNLYFFQSQSFTNAP
jgi:prepilin-type N-terminal cleavage/methylation domain-containing protein